MFRFAKNYAVVSIEKKHQDIVKGMFIDTTWEPENHVTLEGIVVSPPAYWKSDLHRTITGNVNKGDRIFFSYSIVFDKALQPKEDTPVYKNLLIVDGEEYWKVEMGEIFCVISHTGCRMVTSNLLIEPVSEDSGVVIGMPDIKLNCNLGDVVCFEPKYVQKYNIMGKEHYILPSRRIIAKQWI